MDKKELTAWKKASLEVQKIKHENKLEQIELEKQAKIEVTNLIHEKELERQRIKTAEIRKHQERKRDQRFAEGHYNNTNTGYQQ